MGGGETGGGYQWEKEKANNGRRLKQIKLRMETRDQADATMESIQRGEYSGFLETVILIRFLSHT